jgi:pectate lyase
MSPLSRFLPLTLNCLSLASSAFSIPTRRQEAGCLHCEDEAHGFASLTGGTFGGRGGDIVVATSHKELVDFASQEGPLIIRVEGEIVSDPTGFEIPIASNKTIIGIGESAHLIGGGFSIPGTSNIILRNLEVSDTRIAEDWPGKTEDWDGIQVDAGSNIWIDHVKVSGKRCNHLSRPANDLSLTPHTSSPA